MTRNDHGLTSSTSESNFIIPWFFGSKLPPKKDFPPLKKPVFVWGGFVGCLHHLFPTIQLFEPYKILPQRFDSIRISAQIRQHLLRTQQSRLVGTTDGLFRAQNSLASSLLRDVLTPPHPHPPPKQKKVPHKNNLKKKSRSRFGVFKLLKKLIIKGRQFRLAAASIRCKSSTAYKAFCRLNGSSSARRFLKASGISPPNSWKSPCLLGPHGSNKQQKNTKTRPPVFYLPPLAPSDSQ